MSWKQQKFDDDLTIVVAVNAQLSEAYGLLYKITGRLGSSYIDDEKKTYLFTAERFWDRSIFSDNYIFSLDEPQGNVIIKAIDLNSYGVGELSIHQKLNGHPNIVKLLDSHVITTNRHVGGPNFMFLIMEQMTMTLEEYIHTKVPTLSTSYTERNGRITRFVIHGPGKHIVHMMKNIMSGIRHMHVKGVVHGDIKPENVLVTIDPRDNNPPVFKISDFGISLSKDLDGIKHPWHKLCTPEYRPIELRIAYQNTLNKHGPPVTTENDRRNIIQMLRDYETTIDHFNYPAIDIWGVGVILHRVLYTQSHGIYDSYATGAFFDRNVNEIFDEDSIIPIIQHFGNIELQKFAWPVMDQAAGIQRPNEAVINEYLRQRQKTFYEIHYRSSADAKLIDLMFDMLVYNPNNRITAENALVKLEKDFPFFA